jgi:hypothetical protein
MTIKEAEEIAGRLGQTSKMPGPSYGLSAKRCITGSKLKQTPGSVCSTCYAENAFYASWAPLAKGHSKRHDSLDHPRWVDAMTTLIKHAVNADDPVFRWHDSGDLQSVDHLTRIVQVCWRTSKVRHWLPTREYEIVAEYLRDVAPTFPENLCVRLSAHMIDTEPVVPPELLHLPTSTVHTAHGHPVFTAREKRGAVECLAVAKRDNICGDCRACWDRRVTSVSYPQH